MQFSQVCIEVFERLALRPIIRVLFKVSKPLNAFLQGGVPRGHSHRKRSHGNCVNERVLA